MEFEKRPGHLKQVIKALSPTPAVIAVTAPKARRRFISQNLFGEECEVEIEHVGVLYRLRVTSLGKLILTK